MISNVEKENWFYFELLHGITSKYKNFTNGSNCDYHFIKKISKQA